MKIAIRTILALTILLLLSCTDSFDVALLHGDWKTTDWYIIDSGKKINNQMDFSFDADRRYVIDYGSEKENGRY